MATRTRGFWPAKTTLLLLLSFSRFGMTGPPNREPLTIEVRMEFRACSWGVVALLAPCLMSGLFARVALAEGSQRPGFEVEFVRGEFPLEAESVAFTFDGVVRLPDGTPATSAVVVSSAGGQAVTDEDGRFLLSARVPITAQHIQVTAVGGTSGKLLASVQVSIATNSTNVQVPSMHLAQSNSCNPSWLPAFGGTPGTWSNVDALTVFDDGGGAALYAAGRFRGAGGTRVNYVAKWDGTSWKSLGGGLDNWAYCLAVFDDGGGDALFVGGQFWMAGGSPAGRIAKWDGSSWTAVGGGTSGFVYSLTVFNDGGTDVLIAGGQFASMGGVPASRIARWDGASWSALGVGVNGNVRTLMEFDDGTGNALFVGGAFTNAGGGHSHKIAKWDGATWAPVGGGMRGDVRAMVVFDDGNGPDLYVGSDQPGTGNPPRFIARWDGTSWTSLGAGVNGGVSALTVFDDGSGDALFVGGSFTFAGGAAANRMAKWDGSSWTALGSGTGYESVVAMAVFDSGSGDELFVGGGFGIAGEVRARNIARWDGSTWTFVGRGIEGDVASLILFDDGNGKQLYAGGRFAVNTVNGVAKNIAKWDGSAWTGLGLGVSDYVSALSVFDDGGGDALFVGGYFVSAGGGPANYVAKWDGATWAPLGSGTGSTVLSLAVYDDGGGEALYVAGDLVTAGGVAVGQVARWSGTVWSAVGGVQSSGHIEAMAVFDDGNGEQLYVGGTFTVMGGTPALRIAAWDGTNWAALGGGLATPFLPSAPRVTALAVFDNGVGDVLYVGGAFKTAGAVAVDGRATWDGANWAEGGAGSQTSPGVLHASISAFAVFDDGGGERLYAAANYAYNEYRVERLDGSVWTRLGLGAFGRLNALAVFDDGTGPALIAAGRGGFMGEWACPLGLFADYCNGDGGDQLGCTDCPCTNNAAVGTIGGCLNSATASARLLASGNPSVSLAILDWADLRFSAAGLPPMAYCVLSSGDAIAPLDPLNACFGLDRGAQSSMLDGLLCADGNMQRHGGRVADANGDVGLTNDPWGGEGRPPAGLVSAAAGFVAGQSRFFQVIYRDDPLLQCMRGINTSQAVEVVFEP